MAKEIPTISPLTRITAVHWPSSLFAVIEMYSIVSNSTTGTLITPVGTAVSCPIPGLGVNPVRFDPDLGAAPYAFPPTTLMARVEDVWAEDQLMAVRPPGVGDDVTINCFVVNLGLRLKKAPTITFRLNGQNTVVGTLTFKVTCRLFDHIKWKKNLTGSQVFTIDLISPHTGPAIEQASGEKAPVFSTEISRNDLLTSAQMLNDNNPQQFFTIIINRAKKTAAVSPFL